MTDDTTSFFHTPNYRSKKTPLQRFMESVSVDDNGCWIWLKYRNEKGYGVFNINNRAISAHRFSYLAHKGIVEDGLWVLHRCDVPSCVNPDHLFLGTAQDNSTDCVNKGRTPKGEVNANSKVSDDDVVQIRKRYYDGEQTKALSKEFNVSMQTIQRVVRGTGWRHLPSQPSRKKEKINMDIAREIRSRYEMGGTSIKKLAKEFCISTSGVFFILKGKYWKEDGE